MKIEINSTLYHADWCGYCKQFLPEWSKFSKQVETLSDDKIIYHAQKLEESSIPKDQMPTINGKDIRGYPTVKTTIRVNDNVQEIEYTGSRKAADLLDFVKNISKKVINKVNK